MKPFTIFLTGGTGFVGKNILELLGKKYSFLPPSHKDLDLLDESATERFFKTHKPDVVIHTAKLGGTRKMLNSPDIAEKNMRMFFNIVRNNKYFKKMIFLGTGAEYDVSRPLKSVREDEFDKFVPKDSFGFAKYICSKYIERADKIVNLRLFGIYGKYEDYDLRFISNAICKTLFDLPITMRQNVFFDYLYVNDFIEIVNHFINNDYEYKFYNVGRGKKIDLLTIARIVIKISGKNSKIIVKNPGLKNEYTCDNKRMQKELGDFLFTPFEESLRELYSWYESIKSTINKKTLLEDK